MNKKYQAMYEPVEYKAKEHENYNRNKAPMDFEMTRENMYKKRYMNITIEEWKHDELRAYTNGWNFGFICGFSLFFVVGIIIALVAIVTN